MYDVTLLIAIIFYIYCKNNKVNGNVTPSHWGCGIVLIFNLRLLEGLIFHAGTI